MLIFMSAVDLLTSIFPVSLLTIMFFAFNSDAVIDPVSVSRVIVWLAVRFLTSILPVSD